MNKIKCGVVGLGRIGSQLEDDPLRSKPATHAGAVVQNPACELIAGIDSSPVKRNQFSARWGVRAFSTLTEAFSQEKLDIIHIATPTEAHFSVLSECIRSRIPLILCEKPLVASIEEATEIRQLLADSVTKIVTNYPRRYSERYRYMRSMIKEQRYGKLLSLHGVLNYGARRDLRNMLRDDGTHLINTLQFLTNIDSPIVQKSILTETSKGFALFALLDFNGVSTTLEVAPGSDFLLFEIAARFESGRLIINNEAISEFSSGSGKNFSKYRVLNPKPVPITEKESTMANIMDAAISLFRDLGHPDSDIRASIATVQIIEGILSSASRP